MSKSIGLLFMGYLIGSIPFAYLMTRLSVRRDVRCAGDGNVGARNALRVGGPVAGLLTVLLDSGKGAAAYWLNVRWADSDAGMYLTAIGLMLGHGFPIWLRGRGGKGLAAATGFISQLWPQAFIIAAAIAVLIWGLTAHWELSFGVGSAAFLLLTIWQGNDLHGMLLILLLLGMALLKKLIDLPYEQALQRAQESAKTWEDEAARGEIRHR